MKTYARIQEGIVAEIIPPAVWDIDSPEGVTPAFKVGDEIPIDQRYHPSLVVGPVSVMTDITAVNPQPAQNWTATQGTDGSWTFAAPALPKAGE
jgi:hypothetical protein